MENKSPERLVILVDDRELASPVPHALKQIPSVHLLVQRMRVGDYEIANRCVFERKTLPDFAASLVDGRLFVQAQRLAQMTIPAAIVLEGRGSQLAATHVRREALQGALIALSIIFRLPVLRAVDPMETARLLVFSAQQLQREEWLGGCRHGRRPKHKRRLQLHILQGLPGIGPSRAELLLQKFGSVRAAMTASAESLELVEGIGPKTALAIQEALNESPTTYGNPPSPALALCPSRSGMKQENLGSTLRISAVKELAAVNANEFRDWVRRSFVDGQKDIEMDLSQTSFIDSCGLGALVALHKTARNRGGRLRLLSPQPQVQQLLELTRMSQIFEVRVN
jgi:DNA excision repair protein ERCC-4